MKTDLRIKTAAPENIAEEEEGKKEVFEEERESSVICYGGWSKYGSLDELSVKLYHEDQRIY